MLMSTSASQDKPRLTAEDWQQAALDVIAEQGLAAVAVEPLAKRLGVTKGSFYWHFPSREALIKASLEKWEASDQQRVFDPLEHIADPGDRLRELFVLTSREMRSHVIYSALLNQVDHPIVQPIMQRLSQKRIAFLGLAYRALGLNRRESMNRARLAYAAYVGFLQLMLQMKLPRMTTEEYEEYVQHVAETLIPPTPNSGN
ncbi:TetR/AcrR family transcriptional regulator [Ahniella affigens]|uniref:TetR/AcrR family transcriptional regulator n=1 Tax=Ahniella affigens TaxID=2021234 RepID=A0A2P1PUB1_9GAMM|nr:TetR/AcrR family transcriptional regulator [Ahniella affigens]